MPHCVSIHSRSPSYVRKTNHLRNTRTHAQQTQRYKQRYNRAELSALIEIHREVKRRNISIAASSSSASHMLHQQGQGQQGGGGGHQRTVSTGATAARAGLLSMSHPGAEDEGQLMKLGGSQHQYQQQQQQKQGLIAGSGNGAGDAMLSQVCGWIGGWVGGWGYRLALLSIGLALRSHPTAPCTP